MKKVICILLASHLLAPQYLNAADEPSSPLDFTRSLERAFIYDQDLQAAEFQYQSTLESRGQSKAALMPQLNASAFTRRSEEQTENSTNPAVIPDSTIDFNTDGYSFTLNQSIYKHSNYKKLQQTDLTIAAANETILAARQDLIVRLAEVYFNVLGAQDNMKFATAEKEAISKQLEQSKKRFEVGLIAITDIKEAQASYDTSFAQEIDAQNILAANLEALAVILGNYNTQIASMKEDIPLAIPEPANIQKWTEKAIANNPALKAAQFNFQGAQKLVDSDKSEHYPYLDLNAQRNFNSPEGGRFVPSDSTDTSITLQLTVPIYSGGFTSAKHRQSIALKEQARALKEKARRQTLQQTRDAYLGISSSIAQVKALKQALLSTQSAHEATQAGFNAGTRTAIDVLTALREVYRAERDYARARYTYAINTLRLKQAAGTLTVSDGDHINSFLQ